jgi:uncharacterized protein YegL
MTGPALQILPFYLVCDESGSMSGSPIDAINVSLREIHTDVASNPVVADKTRFCLIGFSDHADVLLPLSDLTSITGMPKLSAGGGTDYEVVFKLLRSTIDNDVSNLKRDGHLVYRPAVFFVSDGQPQKNNWQVALSILTDPSWRPHPNIIAFGFGGADVNVIREVATVKAFMADGTISSAESLREFARYLTWSIVSSSLPSAAGLGGGMTLTLPESVPGFADISAPIPAPEI